MKKYKVILENGKEYIVNGNKMVVDKDGTIKVWKLAGEGHVAADDILMSVSPKGSTVYVMSN